MCVFLPSATEDSWRSFIHAVCVFAVCLSVPVCACVCVLELVSRLWVFQEHYEFDMIQYSLKTCMFVCVYAVKKINTYFNLSSVAASF